MQREDVERLATELDRQDEYAPLGHMGWESAAALRALLAERDAARAEIERLTKELEEMAATKDIHKKKRYEYFERAEKAEAENERLTKERYYKQTVIEKLSNHIEKAEAERDEALALLADAYGAGTGGSVIEAHLADAERDMRQRAADSCLGLMTAQSARKFILALPLKHADREGRK